MTVKHSGKDTRKFGRTAVFWSVLKVLWGISCALMIVGCFVYSAKLFVVGAWMFAPASILLGVRLMCGDGSGRVPWWWGGA